MFLLPVPFIGQSIHWEPKRQLQMKDVALSIQGFKQQQQLLLLQLLQLQ